MLTQKGQNNPVKFAEIFVKMVSQLLHDFELFILFCACCEFKLIYVIEFLNVILVFVYLFRNT